MTAIPHSPLGFLPFYLEGSSTPLKDSGPNGATLANGATYYVEAGGDASLVQAVQIDWDSSIIMTITLEDTLWDIGSGAGQATLSQVAGRAWCPENPSTGIVGVSGGTSSALTVTVPGGTAGTCIYHVGNTGAKRNRLKIVVGGTGGNANARSHGKH